MPFVFLTPCNQDSRRPLHLIWEVPTKEKPGAAVADAWVEVAAQRDLLKFAEPSLYGPLTLYDIRAALYKRDRGMHQAYCPAIHKRIGTLYLRQYLDAVQTLWQETVGKELPDDEHAAFIDEKLQERSPLTGHRIPAIIEQRRGTWERDGWTLKVAALDVVLHTALALSFVDERNAWHALVNMENIIHSTDLEHPLAVGARLSTRVSDVLLAAIKKQGMESKHHV